MRILRRELQSSVESFEAANEELKASNEEVTSINEELQSANEELETGKEELQALNEELLTVNEQLQSKLIELEALTNDLDNLLSSTSIAVVFLDAQLRVRRFTPAINDLLELLLADIGRPLAHLAQKFSDGNLLDDTATVLSRLTPLESEALSQSGRWYLKRTLPYRTEDNRIAGVVITFVDITARKRAEMEIVSTQNRLQAVLEQMPTAVLMIDCPNGKFLLGNRLASTLFDQPYPLPFVGLEWTSIYAAIRGVHPDGRPFQRHEWPRPRIASASGSPFSRSGEAENPSPSDLCRVLSVLVGVRAGQINPRSPVRRAPGTKTTPSPQRTARQDVRASIPEWHHSASTLPSRTDSK